MNGQQIKYAQLLGLRIEQPFYLNHYCKKYTSAPDPDFLLVPTAECEDTMKRLDYLYRFTNANGGLIIFSRVNGTNGGGDDLLQFLPARADKLCFWMLLKNPSAFNFNQLQVSIDPAKFFYFSNQVTDGAAPRNNLHISAGVGVDEMADTVVKRNSIYQFNHAATVNPNTDTMVVKHTITGIEIKPTNITNQSASSVLYFDLSPLPQGHCKLFINSGEKDAFYYTGVDAPQHVFGVIELLLATTLDANYRIVEADRSLTNERPFYNLPFVNRATLWRYTLELESNSPLFLEMEALSPADKTDFINRLNIITNDTSINFTQTSAGPDGKIFQFTSDVVIALQEKYFSSSSITNETLSLLLKKYVGNLVKEAAVRTDLQCPSTGGIDASNNPVIYSDILLTI